MTAQLMILEFEDDLSLPKKEVEAKEPPKEKPKRKRAKQPVTE